MQINNLYTTQPGSFQRQARVLYALMLRDMRTRFFGNGLGYIVSVAWPLSHIIILLAIFTASGRTAPYGDSLILFFSTGLIPFMTFSYMSRFIMLSLVLNKPLLSFPVVHILDILVARAILEILSACVVTISICSLMWFMGVDFMPRDVPQASFALGASILLGLGLGISNAIIALALPMWVTGYTLLIIAFWASSGIVFIPDTLPETIRYFLSFHPVLQTVEWMRSAYYDGYGATILDRNYVLGWGFGSVFVGLALERIIRAKLTEG